MKRLMYGAVCAALLGMVGGFLGSYIRSAPPSPGAPYPRPPEVLRSPNRDAPARRIDTATEGESTSKPAAPPVAGTDTGPLDIAEVIERLEALSPYKPPQPATGPGVVRGRVTTDGDRRPVAGVRITADPLDHGNRRPEEFLGPAPEDYKQEWMILRMLAADMHATALRLTTVTDAEGRYVLSGLTRQNHMLQGNAAGYRLLAEDNAVVTPDAVLDFKAVPMTDVDCSVLLPDGTEPINATIRTSDGRSAQWSPDRPMISLPAGQHDLTASAGDNSEYAAKLSGITLRTGVTERMAFRLTGTPGIRGRLTLPKGFAPDNLILFAVEQRDGEFPCDRMNLMRSRQGWTSAHRGYEYCITKLNPGEHLLVAVGSGYAPILASRQVSVVDDIVQCDLIVTPGADCLRVWAIGPDGERLPKLQLSTAAPRAMSVDLFGLNENGFWWIYHPLTYEGDFVEDGSTCTLTAQSPLYGTRKVDYRKGQQSEVTIHFAAVADLSVRVEWKNRPADAALELAIREIGKTAMLQTKPVSGPATVTFGKVSVRQCDLLLLVKGRSTQWIIESKKLQLEEGENEAAIVVPPLYPLILRAPNPDYGINVHMTFHDPERGASTDYTKVDPGTRTLAYPGLPAGRYTIRMIHGDRTGRMDISIPEQSDVEFESPDLNAVQIWIQDPDSYPAKAGLRSGDTIVALNGVPFKRLVNVDGFLNSHAGAHEVTLTVIRNNSLAEVVVDPNRLKGPGPWGRFETAVVVWEE